MNRKKDILFAIIHYLIGGLFFPVLLTVLLSPFLFLSLFFFFFAPVALALTVWLGVYISSRLLKNKIENRNLVIWISTAIFVVMPTIVILGERSWSYYYLFFPGVGLLSAIFIGGIPSLVIAALTFYFASKKYLASAVCQDVNADESVNIKEKRESRWFRWKALIAPAIIILLGIAHETAFGIYVYWHPIFSQLFKLCYFPFYIFSEKTNDALFVADGGFIAIPNPNTVGIAILVPLVLAYLFSRFAIHIQEKKSWKYILLFANISLFAILLMISSFMADSETSKCVAEQNSNKNRPDRKQLISIFFDDSPLRDSKYSLGLFYLINGIKYVYDGGSTGEIVVMTGPGKEAATACKLDSIPGIRAYPTSTTDFFGTPSWEEKRNILCQMEGFKSDQIKECTEFLLKDTEVLKGREGDVKINDKGYVEAILKDPVDNSGNYSDDKISFRIDKSKFKFFGGVGIELPKVGATQEDIQAGNFMYQYTIEKFAGYEGNEGKKNFAAPIMNILIPNPSGQSSTETFEKMFPNLQVISASKVQLGSHEYTRKILADGSRLEKVIYSAEVNGKKVGISLLPQDYFDNGQALQKEFEDIISSVDYKFGPENNSAGQNQPSAAPNSEANKLNSSGVFDDDYIHVNYDPGFFYLEKSNIVPSGDWIRSYDIFSPTGPGLGTGVFKSFFITFYKNSSGMNNDQFLKNITPNPNDPNAFIDQLGKKKLGSTEYVKYRIDRGKGIYYENLTKNHELKIQCNAPDNNIFSESDVSTIENFISSITYKQ